MMIRIKIPHIFFCLFLLLLCACGQGLDSAAQRDPFTNGATGGYRTTLLFPKDLPRIETPAKALTDIDCVAAGIATIEFNFILNGKQYGPHPFPCEAGHATISTAPAGTGVIVEVFADDTEGNAILEGSEKTDIQADQVTTGGQIAMDYVPPEGASFANSLGMTFVRIPKGAFTMGSPPAETGRNDNETQHQVILTQDFYMQTTEVTQAQWAAVVQAAGSVTTLNPSPSYFTECGESCPVEQVSWAMIDQFIQRLNTLGEGTYALPTEAQWEYAARAGIDTAFANGPMNSPIDNCYADENLDAMGWYCYNSQNTIHPVGQKEPNEWGLYDMHGNVYEWVADWYGTYPTTVQTNPTGPSDGAYRVMRSGSFEYLAQGSRSAYRFSNAPDSAGYACGFRLVCRQFSR
jgi:formylglycine-generating enzyme required for sulfatase activity